MMLRNKKSGFTLVELMVVIVIIGVLATLAIPRFNEASLKAKVAEAPRVLASFESAYLSLVAEVGTVDAANLTNLVFEVPPSKWWGYGTGVTGATATASSGIGGGLNGQTLVVAYAGNSFNRIAGGSLGRYLPNFKPDATSSSGP